MRLKRLKYGVILALLIALFWSVWEMYHGTVFSYYAAWILLAVAAFAAVVLWEEL